MILSLNSFKPLSSNCLEVDDEGFLVLYGKSEVIIARVLRNGELDRIRITTKDVILRGHFYKQKLALITSDLRLHVYSPRSEEDLWLPWIHKEYDFCTARSCIWLDGTTLLIGFDDGSIKSFCCETGRTELVSASTGKAVTVISKHISGHEAGEIFKYSPNVQTLQTNDLMCPTLLDAVDDYTLISKYDTAFLFSASELIREFKVDGCIVGGSILSAQSFRVCCNKGTVFSSISDTSNEPSIGNRPTLGFACTSSFQASVQYNGSEWALHISGQFPLADVPSGLLYDACRLVSCSESPLSLSSIASELGTSVSAIKTVVPFEDDGLFEELKSNEEPLYKTTKALEEYFIVGSRSIHLTEASYRALKLICSSGRDGLVQGDLCKLLGIDHKTIFHHLKILIQQGLIIRFPVTLNKTFTYILLHWSFAEEEPSLNNDNFNASSFTVRELILKTLQTAPSNALTTNELFTSTQIASRKVYQKAVSTLACQGHIEYFRGTEIGQRDSLIRLKLSKPATPVNSEDSSSDDDSEEDNSNITSRHVVGLPLSFQLKQLIAGSKETGITSSEICEHLGMSSKAAHRILGRIIGKPPHCQDVQKQAEFSGRQRRFRFFDSRNYPSEQPISYFTSSPKSNLSVIGKNDSVNRTNRINAIMQLLKENDGLMEVSRPLATRLTSILKSEYSLDSKTLKRTVTLMEEEGFVKTITVSLQKMTKTLVMLPDVSQTQIDEFVEQMKTLGRPSSPIAIADEEEDKEKVGVADPEFEVEKYDYGFVLGSMARAKLLHAYLLSKAVTEDEIYIVDSTAAIFKELPIHMYAKLIGIEKSSMSLLEALRTDENRSVSEFKLNMRKLRSVVEKLLELLEEENLLRGPLRLNIPLTLQLCSTWNDMNLPEDFEAIWDNIQENSMHPERWILKPLTAKERRTQKKLLRQIESITPTLTPEDMSYLDSLLNSPAPSEASQPAQPVAFKVYSDEEDYSFLVAITVAFHFRDRYSEMFGSAARLPFRLLSRSLFPEVNEKDQTLELRRRVKNFAHNSTDRQTLRKLDRDVCFIERMEEAGLLKMPLDERLTAALESEKRDLNEADDEEEDGPKEVLENNQLMIQEFRRVFEFIMSGLQNMDNLKRMVEEHHRNITVVDLSRLKPVIPETHVDLVSALESEYRTRTETIDEYYALIATKRSIVFPDGFSEFRGQLIEFAQDQNDPSLRLEVAEELLETAVKIGLLVKTGKKKARLYINSIPYQVNSDALLLPQMCVIPEAVEELNQESPEGVLTLMATGEIEIDPVTLNIKNNENQFGGDQNKTLLNSWMSGRWNVLSTEERNYFLNSL